MGHRDRKKKYIPLSMEVTAAMVVVDGGDGGLGDKQRKGESRGEADT